MKTKVLAQENCDVSRITVSGLEHSTSWSQVEHAAPTKLKKNLWSRDTKVYNVHETAARIVNKALVNLVTDFVTMIKASSNLLTAVVEICTPLSVLFYCKHN